MVEGHDDKATMGGAGESGLCTQCGLCCDGSLFHAVKVGASECGPLRNLGIAVEDAVEPFFTQPCSQLLDRSCAIYAARPRICRNFSCALLRKLRAGTIALREAEHVVATARVLRDRAGTLPSPLTDATDDGQADWQGIADPAARQSAAKRHLDRVVLNEFLSRHFRVTPANATHDPIGPSDEPSSQR